MIVYYELIDYILHRTAYKTKHFTSLDFYVRIFSIENLSVQFPHLSSHRIRSLHSTIKQSLTHFNGTLNNKIVHWYSLLIRINSWKGLKKELWRNSSKWNVNVLPFPVTDGLINFFCAVFSVCTYVCLCVCACIWRYFVKLQKRHEHIMTQAANSYWKNIKFISKWQRTHSSGTMQMVSVGNIEAYWRIAYCLRFERLRIKERRQIWRTDIIYFYFKLWDLLSVLVLCRQFQCCEFSRKWSHWMVELRCSLTLSSQSDAFIFRYVE